MKILSVIIPCHNEAETISSVLENTLKVNMPNWKIEIIVVDDGSTDKTRLILQEYSSRLKVIYQPRNMGKGTAVNTGLRQASGDYMMIQDADLEYDPAEIPEMIAAMESAGSDVVYGSRNIHRTKRKDSYITRFGTWLTTMEFNLLFGTHLTDIWTCYKIFPRETAHFYIAGGFESDLILSARLAKNGYIATEIPISYRPRTVQEGKKIRYRDGFRGLWILIRERFAPIEKTESAKPTRSQN